jgi:hypothetical protein
VVTFYSAAVGNFHSALDRCSEFADLAKNSCLDHAAGRYCIGEHGILSGNASPKGGRNIPWRNSEELESGDVNESGSSGGLRSEAAAAGPVIWLHSRDQRDHKRLSEHLLLVEKRWNTHEKANKPYFVTRSVSVANQSVSVDAEACGIMLTPEHKVAMQAGNTATPRLLEVADPEIRLLRSSTKFVSNNQDEYFQSQVVFYLVDRSGGIPCPLKVQCNRPQFLVGNGLADFAIESVSEALKLTPQGGRSDSLPPPSVH